MHLTKAGDWHDVITNAPNIALLRLREQLLVNGVTNTDNGGYRSLPTRSR
jgi:hypothetical protein